MAWSRMRVIRKQIQHLWSVGQKIEPKVKKNTQHIIENEMEFEFNDETRQVSQLRKMDFGKLSARRLVPRRALNNRWNI